MMRLGVMLLHKQAFCQLRCRLPTHEETSTSHRAAAHAAHGAARVRELRAHSTALCVHFSFTEHSQTDITLHYTI